jgi:hypothetical protein
MAESIKTMHRCHKLSKQAPKKMMRILYSRLLIVPRLQEGNGASEYKYFGPYLLYLEIAAILQGIEEQYDLQAISFQACFRKVGEVFLKSLRSPRKKLGKVPCLLYARNTRRLRSFLTPRTTNVDIIAGFVPCRVLIYSMRLYQNW